MGSRAVHVLVFDGFADWEPAYALAELRRWGKRAVVVIGFTASPVTSMGGLRVAPEYSGTAGYDAALAVNDRGVITASGLGPVDFARAIFRELNIFTASNEQLWFDMFKHGQLPTAAV